MCPLHAYQWKERTVFLKDWEASYSFNDHGTGNNQKRPLATLGTWPYAFILRDQLYLYFDINQPNLQKQHTVTHEEKWYHQMVQQPQAGKCQLLVLHTHTCVWEAASCTVCNHCASFCQKRCLLHFQHILGLSYMTGHHGSPKRNP